VNVQSLKNKINLVQCVLSEHHYDVLCFSETLLKKEHQILQFPGYNIIRNDITKKGQRGIAILINDKLKCWECKYEIMSENIEMLMVKVQNSFKNH